MNRSLRPRLRALAATVLAASTFVALGPGLTSSGASLPPPVLVGYVPLPADHLVTMMKAVNSAAGTTLDQAVGITNAGAGAVIVYDEWEDGFEADLTAPVQSTTKVWGDALTGNGDAAGVCAVCTGDLVPQGAVFVLRNDVDTPRIPSTVVYDGGDKVTSTRGFALTSAAWTTDIGSVLASAVSAYDRSKYGTSYVVPVGENTATPSGASPAFEYTGASVMAAYDGTVVRVDLDGNGTVDLTSTLDEGEAYLVDGGLLQGGRITSTAPVQVDLVTGDVGASYESRSYLLFPDELLTNDYMNPVGTTASNQDTVIYLHNPGSSSLTITPTCPSCSGTVVLAPAATSAFRVPAGEAVRFASPSGTTFTALGAVGAHSGAVGAGSDSSHVYDWGFTLVPSRMLTTQVVLGWAPGNSALPTPTDDDDDPVWVASLATTTLRIDYDGDPSTGAMGADCYGQHDAEIPLAAYASTTLTDTSDNSMTGARIYTCDGTKLVGAYGEDPANAPSGSPGLDAGYTLVPSTTMVVDKTSAVLIDGDGDGKPGPGDTLEYRVVISDAGSLAFTNVAIEDPLGPGMSYVAGSTTFVSGVTTTPIADDASPATPFPLDTSPYPLPDLAAGASYEVRYRVTVASPFPTGATALDNDVTVTADEADSYDHLTTTLATDDLSVTVASTAPVTNVGDDATFRITLVNAGPDAATGVVVHAPVPAGTTYVSSTPSFGTYSSSTGDWTIGTVAPGGTKTLDLVVDLGATSVTQFAEVTAAGGVDVDSRPAENAFDAGHAADEDDEDDATVTVAGLIDLELTKEAVSGPDADGLTTFRLTLTNQGPTGATGVQVVDLPAAGTTQDGATASTGTFNAGTHTWSVPTLASGATATLDLVQTVSVLPSAHDAQVTVQGQNDVDSQPAENALDATHAPDQDDEARVTVYPPGTMAGAVWLDPDGDGSRESGEPGMAGIDVTVTGAGPDATFGTGDDTTATDVTDADGIWSVPGLVPGSYRVTIDPADLPAGVTVPTYDVDGTGTSRLATVTLTADEVRSDVDFGERGTAAVAGTVFDDGDRDGALDGGEGLAGVTVRAVWAGADASIGTADDATVAVVTTDGGAWSAGGLPAGAVGVTVDRSTAPARLTLIVADPDSTLDAATSVVLAAGEQRGGLDVGLAAPPVNLGVSQQVEGTVLVGSPVTFTVTVANTTGDVDGPITVVDDLPASLRFVSAGNAEWSCTADGQRVTCVHAGPLAAGASTSFPLTAMVLSAGDLRNVVSVAVQGDVQPSDDSAAATVQASRRLPSTGADDPRTLVRLALVLVAFGAGLVVLGRTRRRRTA